MKTAAGLIVLVVTVGGIYVLNDQTRTDDGKSFLNVAGETPLEIKVAKPQRRDIVRIVQALGEVEATAEVDISAEVAGKVIEMPIEEGDSVKEGDLLCRLDDVDFRARVRSAEAVIAQGKARLIQSKADLEKADRDFARQRQLSEANATSALELANYETTFIRAEATVAMGEQELIQSQWALEAAKDDLAKTVIIAPMDGVVSQLFAKQGEVVITGTMNNPGTRIMVITDLSRMQVRCRVDEGDVPLVQTDQSAAIYLQSDMYRDIPGHVLRVATKGIRPAGRDVVTFETLVLVDSDDPSIKPGMNANVEIEVGRSKDALTVPLEAVVYRRRRDVPEALAREFDALQEGKAAQRRQRGSEYLKVVYCKDGDVARVRLVQTGISDETGVEILGGIDDNDSVVVGPYRSLDQLKDASPVRLEADVKGKTAAKKGS